MSEHRYRQIGNVEKVLAYGTLTVLAAGVAVLIQLALKPEAKDPLVVYAAASLRPALQPAAAAYTQEFGTPIRIEYGASGELIGKLKLEQEQGKGRADLYLPADASFAEKSAAAGLTTESVAIARLQLVLALHPGVESPPDSLAALLDSGLPYALCDPGAGAGALTASILADSYPAIKDRAKVSFPRVTEAAAAIALAMNVHAGIVWDATAKQFELTIVRAPELANASSTITANLVTNSPRLAEAKRFADYLATAADDGKFFPENGFSPLTDD